MRPSPQPLDFETITNPLGPPLAVREALASLDPAATPDLGWRALRNALASRMGVSAEQIWAGEGLLHCLLRAFVRPGQRALILTPSPPIYVDAVLEAGGEALEHEGRRDPRTGWGWEATGLRGLGVACAVLGSPNDPTGAYLGPEKVRAFARALAPAPLIVDESLLPFFEDAGDMLSLLSSHPNLVVLRSLGREYGLGSLAVEYVVGSVSLMERVGAATGPTGPTTVAAQVAGLVALETGERHVARGRKSAQEGGAVLRQGLTEAGLEVASPATASYVLVRTPGDASETTRALLRRDYRVLDCTPLEMPRHIRIAARRPEAVRGLLDVLIDVINA